VFGLTSRSNPAMNSLTYDILAFGSMVSPAAAPLVRKWFVTLPASVPFGILRQPRIEVVCEADSDFRGESARGQVVRDARVKAAPVRVDLGLPVARRIERAADTGRPVIAKVEI